MEPRQLIIMRHATADPNGHRDHERSLTAKGLDEAQRVGHSLRSKGPIPDRILCSSAVRCRQTWQAVSAELECSPTVDFQDDLYNASAASLLNSLAGVGEEQTVLLLAHNPGVSVLTRELAAGDEEDIARLRVGFAPATVACFEVEGPWSLISPASARLTRLERAPQP
jgi:phosphohistidine phosphatase